MSWFGGSPSKVSAVKQVERSDTNDNSQYLDDLPPKFEDREPIHAKQPTYGDAFRNLKLSDFSLETYVGMPCFREAMITGFQSMGVLGFVTFLIHKNPGRSVNWAICGFFLGSVVGWEQCRSIRKKSFQTVEAARVANQDKVRRKLEDRSADDETLSQFNKTQTGECE
ncbi:hypothetical protein METBIDRAFT_31770 [Metschnikowia bicuspidata var. bicuspidata NRRL YB-4993]|uniref:Cytochrome c oxidase assembly protein COX20, mitochondrial n=1 Tax=Metschnikowia bicuspidata var. bicuspidata NRRL YB-4993 TaxID=869754 RepID=A0A1A0HBD6_9ASCO|nr:hypothetical protein METBIDRAFT_31770 [Metschnikowia bicuspidata var. bicuspidata NRRL YB-4993]OBA21187.1 hypothetical protein METBIDRAFT_31770 [Metschnikowia bicuspidata var. bicuspidata NRRL YB-4993]